MRYRIERLSFGGALDQSFLLLRDHFVPMVSVFAAVLVPYTVCAQLLSVPDPVQAPGRMLGLFGLLLIFLGVMPLAQLTLNAMILDAYLGAPNDWRSALRRARSGFMAYLGTASLMMLALIPLMMLLFLPGVYFAICWSLIGPIAMLEQLSGRAALSRSRALVKGHFWRVFGMVLVTALVGAVSTFLASLLTHVPVLGALVSGALQAVLSTFTAALLVVLYIDLRCRHENFDLRLLAAHIARSSSAPPSMAAAAARSSDAPSV